MGYTDILVKEEYKSHSAGIQSRIIQAGKNFWEDAKNNTYDWDTFHRAFDDKLEQLNLLYLFNDDGTFTGKYVYGDIKARYNRSQADWAISALMKLWKLIYVDGAKSKQEIKADQEAKWDAEYQQVKGQYEQAVKDAADKAYARLLDEEPLKSIITEEDAIANEFPELSRIKNSSIGDLVGYTKRESSVSAGIYQETFHKDILVATVRFNFKFYTDANPTAMGRNWTSSQCTASFYKEFDSNWIKTSADYEEDIYNELKNIMLSRGDLKIVKENLAKFRQACEEEQKEKYEKSQYVPRANAVSRKFKDAADRGVEPDAADITKLEDIIDTAQKARNSEAASWSGPHDDGDSGAAWATGTREGANKIEPYLSECNWELVDEFDNPLIFGDVHDPDLNDLCIEVMKEFEKGKTKFKFLKK